MISGKQIEIDTVIAPIELARRFEEDVICKIMDEINGRMYFINPRHVINTHILLKCNGTIKNPFDIEDELEYIEISKCYGY